MFAGESLSCMSRVAIIGAGLGGLSAASQLIANGYDVTIFERESNVGGRARRVTAQTPKGEYLTEIGPTVFTMLDVARIPFETLGIDMDKRVEMIKVDPSYRGIFADGSSLDWSADKETRFQRITSLAGTDQAQGFEDYVSWLEKLVKVEYDKFVAKNFDSVFDLLKTPGALARLLQMGAFSHMDKRVGKFISDPRLISMSTFQALYAGVTPSQALAVYCIISYMDLVQGVYYPKGGMCAYGEALADAMRDSGVKIHLETNVSKVETLRSGAHRIHSGNANEDFDAVICNADLAYAYPEIFESDMPRRIRNGRYSPSCLVYVVGGSASSHLSNAHHTIHFSKDDKTSFDQLVKTKTMMTNPSFLVSRPTASDPTISPDGTDVFYLLEPCPHLDSQVEFEKNRELHIERMRGHLTKAGIELSRVDCEIFIDPNDWEQQRMFRGTPFSLAHTFFQSGPFRPKNRIKSKPGLFFCGTGTTPGVGIPMVIESGRLSAEVAHKYLVG